MAKSTASKQSLAAAITMALVADHTVIVVRDKKQVEVPPGEPFEFYGDEVKQILKSRPGSLRKLVNEEPGKAPSEDPTDDDLVKEAEALKAEDAQLIGEADEKDSI